MTEKSIWPGFKAEVLASTVLLLRMTEMKTEKNTQKLSSSGEEKILT